jgi:hypothetical protein
MEEESGRKYGGRGWEEGWRKRVGARMEEESRRKYGGRGWEEGWRKRVGGREREEGWRKRVGGSMEEEEDIEVEEKRAIND